MDAHIRQGLSHMLYVPTTPEGVTCSPLSGTTCLSDGPPCPIRRREYAADRSESMPHGVRKTKTPTPYVAWGFSTRKSSLLRSTLAHFAEHTPHGAGGRRWTS